VNWEGETEVVPTGWVGGWVGGGRRPLWDRSESGREMRRGLDQGCEEVIGSLPEEVRGVTRECERLRKADGTQVCEGDYTRDGVSLTQPMTEQEFDT